MKKILSLNAEIERVNSLDEDLRNQLLQKERELKEKMAQNRTTQVRVDWKGRENY